MHYNQNTIFFFQIVSKCPHEFAVIVLSLEILRILLLIFSKTGIDYFEVKHEISLVCGINT